jgi:transposase
LPACKTENFPRTVDAAKLDEETKTLIAPLMTVLRSLETELAVVEELLARMAQADSILQLCATVPGVGLIVAATFVSVIDDARRFKNAHDVGAYLGGWCQTRVPLRRRAAGAATECEGGSPGLARRAAWRAPEAGSHGAESGAGGPG